jgi:PhnB protein
MAVKYIPEGHQAVIPYLMAPSVAKLIDFLKHTFGAQEVGDRTTRPDGAIMHAEVRIGDSTIMMGEPTKEFPATAASVYVYVPDTDEAYRRALEAGGSSVMEPADQFYGDRTAGVRDTQGNFWWIGTHQEEISPEEMKRRADAYMSGS